MMKIYKTENKVSFPKVDCNTRKFLCCFVIPYDIFENIRIASNNIAFSLLVILLRHQLLGIFTDDPLIMSIASVVIVIDLFVEIGRALNDTLSGALQAAGDVVYQFVVNQASNWIVSVGMAYLLGIFFHMGLTGVWIAFALDEATRGLILLKRWRGKRWVEKAERRRKQLIKEE